MHDFEHILFEFHILHTIMKLFELFDVDVSSFFVAYSIVSNAAEHSSRQSSRRSEMEGSNSLHYIAVLVLVVNM